jgi:hypothetical protein
VLVVQFSEKTENLENRGKNVAIYQQFYEIKERKAVGSTLLDEIRKWQESLTV